MFEEQRVYRGITQRPRRCHVQRFNRQPSSNINNHSSSNMNAKKTSIGGGIPPARPPSTGPILSSLSVPVLIHSITGTVPRFTAPQ